MAIDLMLDRVKKVFPNGTVAVEEFSLEVEHGEFIALLGPSGCGKTTTLRMIGGFDDPTSGSIYLSGQKVNGIPPERRHTNLIFQNYALFPHMDVAGNVEYGLRVKGMPKSQREAKVREVLGRVGLSDVIKRPVDQISDGQRQRVAIARALAVEPALLLLDEPLAALDANTRAQLQIELKALQRQLGITFILVTHAQSEAMAVADRIVVMNRGRVEQVGTPAEIYSALKTKFVAQFVGKNNLFAGKVVNISGDRVDVETKDGRIPAPKPTALVSVGAEVAVVVRADSCRVQGNDRQSGAEEMALKGVLSGEEIIGSIFTYSVQLGSGTAMWVEQHESLSDQVPELDSPVTVWWPIAETVVLSE